MSSLSLTRRGLLASTLPVTAATGGVLAATPVAVTVREGRVTGSSSTAFTPR